MSASVKPGRHDAAARRRSSRKGRERGCSLYVSGDELAGAGIDLDGPPPAYRIWPGRKGTLIVQLYAERTT